MEKSDTLFFRSLRRSARQFAFLCYFLPAAISWGQSNDGDRELSDARAFSALGQFDGAIVSFGKARDCYAASGIRDRYYFCIAGIVDCTLREMRYADADSLLGPLLNGVRAELGENNRVTAEAYRLAGYLRSYQNRYDEALEYNTRGLTIWKELLPDDQLTQSSFQFGIGLTHFRKGDGGAALAWLQRADRAQRASGSSGRPALVSTLIALGQTEALLGHVPEAVRKFNEALSLLDTLGLRESSTTYVCRHHLAVTLRESGRMREGFTWELSALEIARKIYGHNHMALGGVLAQLGDYCMLEGDFDAARTYYDESLLTIAGVVGPDHSSTREIERKLARLCFVEGKADTAALLYRHILRAQAEDFGPRNPGIALLYSEAGEATLAIGDATGARKLFDQALELLPGSDKKNRAGVLLSLGNACGSLGQYAEAEEALRDALSCIDSIGTSTGELRSALYEGLGNLREREAKSGEALQYFERALDELGVAGVAESLRLSPEARPHAIRLLVQRAGILAATAGRAPSGDARLREALSSCDRAASLIVESRDWFRAEGSKLSAQQQLERVCGDGLALAWELWRRTSRSDYREKAFNFAELSRAGLLLEDLEGSSNHWTNSTPASITVTLRSQASRLTHLIEWTRRYGEKNQLHTLNEELVRVYDRINAAEDSIAQAQPGQRERSFRGKVLSLREVQSRLDPQTCLLLYAQAGGRLFVFAITRDRCEFVPAGNWAPADSLAGALRLSLRTLSRSEYLAAARSLFRILMAPVAATLRRARHLVIAPNGSLSYVPFEALIAPGETPDRTPNFLVLTHDVSYTPSSTVYCFSKAPPGRRTGQRAMFEGFAPVFGPRNMEGTDRQRQYLSQFDPLATRSISMDGKVFNELPYSLDEIRRISGMFMAKGQKALCIAEEEATEESFKANAGSAEVLHIATHGFINEEQPALSALLFSPVHGHSSTEDGVLYAREVYDLHLTANLVVLSSCESGVGMVAAGEGVMAMSRAFVAAGAKAVTYSLWKVNDRQTGVLMVEFYRNILAGKTYAAALAGAKRTMIKGRSGANPYFWAGFVLMGK
jgi:CHAT domain-containing protein